MERELFLAALLEKPNGKGRWISNAAGGVRELLLPALQAVL